MRLSIPAGLPKSLIWFVVTGIVFLLQLFPYTGVFLMIVAAPFWSVILLNVGFVALALEVVIGRASLAWLLAPLIWFGGYTLAAWQSERAFERFGQEIAAFNEGKSLPANLDTHDIVFDGKNSNLHPATLVQQYDVSTVYSANANFKIARHLATRLGTDPLCSAVRSDQRYRAASIHVMGLHEETEPGNRKTRKPVSAMCIINAPQDPQKSPIQIAGRQERRSHFLLPATVTHITISNAQGRKVELKHGTGATLSGWPKLAMGCALNSAAPSWSCDAGFMRDSARPAGGSGSATAAVAQALGLQLASASSRRDAINAMPEPGLQETIGKREDTSLATLDRAIANPALNVTVHDLAGLTQNPDLLVSRADGMVEALRTRLSAQRPVAEGVKNFGMLIAALPAREFSRVAPDVLAILHAANEVSIHNVSDALAFRLADLGPIALPIIERYAFERPVLWAGSPIRALCRIGAPAAHHADKIAQNFFATKRTSEYHMAAFIALHRFGRADLAALDPDRESSYRRRDYEYWEQSITPSSPAEDCSGKRALRG